jgi:hypothetical protein
MQVRYRITRLACTLLGTVAMSLGGVVAGGPAHAAGSGAMGVYQVGLSFNCTKGDCGDGYGGFWGWWEFDSPANDRFSGSGGDGQAEGCSHGGGFNGAGHSVFDIHDWRVAVDPSMGIDVFYASWTEVDTSKGQTEGPYEVTDQSTGVPAITVHRPLLTLFGIPTPPGQSMNVQVAWKPAH